MLPHAYTHSKSWFKNQDLFKYPREVLGNIQLKNKDTRIYLLRKITLKHSMTFFRITHTLGLRKHHYEQS